MDFEAILRDLRDPRAHPRASSPPVVIRTHASAVVLAGEDVYKLKRPVDLGFLDYSTLERRRLMCEAEVTLNRRLAPSVYLGVVPITEQGGRAVLGGVGDPIEYAVHMRRLPDEARLGERLAAGAVNQATMAMLGRTIATFHASAPRESSCSRWARLESVRENCRDNFAALARFAGVLASREELASLSTATEAELAAQSERIERRALSGVPCLTHGDLRLEHVYVFEDGRIVVLDCVEFSERFSAADPVSDLAFLVMDLRAHGAWREARQLLDAYFDSTGDEDGRALVPLYVAYRSAVRAKVRALQAESTDLGPCERETALRLARGHVRLAAGELARPSERACLVLVGGLPGTGKSVLSSGLAREAGFTWVRADSVRKELAGLPPLADGSARIRDGIYTGSWNDRTYDECLARATASLKSGRRALVDATFKEERRRLAFLDAARDLGVPALFFVCSSSPETVRARLQQRGADASDADWIVFEHVRDTWEPLGRRSSAVHTLIPTAASIEDSLQHALAALANAGLRESAS